MGSAYLPLQLENMHSFMCMHGSLASYLANTTVCSNLTSYDTTPSGQQEVNYDATQAIPNAKLHFQAQWLKHFHPTRCDKLNCLTRRMIAHLHVPIVLRLPMKIPVQLPEQLALATKQQHPTTLYPQQHWPNQAYMTMHLPLHCFSPAHTLRQSQIATRNPKYELACKTGLAGSADTASLHGHF